MMTSRTAIRSSTSDVAWMMFLLSTATMALLFGMVPTVMAFGGVLRSHPIKSSLTRRHGFYQYTGLRPPAVTGSSTCCILTGQIPSRICWTTSSVLMMESPSNSDSSTSSSSSRGTPLFNRTAKAKIVQEVNYFTLPRHSNPNVDRILLETEHLIQSLHNDTAKQQPPPNDNQTTTTISTSLNCDDNNNNHIDETSADNMSSYDAIFANSYVDLGKIDTVGFDYDYTLVTYTEELLELIYDLALKRLVQDRHYPQEMLEVGLAFDPFFSIRGLAVDKETGWVCHLSYTHKAAVAWEGREKVPTSRIYREYNGKRALNPKERKSRLKPLNDLFSMAECCLIADTIQFFKDRNIDFSPSNAVKDVLDAIRDTHLSGDCHRVVANDPERYFRPTPHLKSVLANLKAAGKRLIFASNSPYWYVNEGMKYVLGDDWMKMWDAIIVSAGKPEFYTKEGRPFREINKDLGRLTFKKVNRLEPGAVYAEGCLRELVRLMHISEATGVDSAIGEGAVNLATSSVLYIGDSLFADLVDAKRDFGWNTAAVTPEVRDEMAIQQQDEYVLVERTIEYLLNSLRMIQSELGPVKHTREDSAVLDSLERLVSKWRDRETDLLGNPFGSVFRARFQPSLFAHSLRRYCDLYMASVGSLRHYSPQHRFYPEKDFRLLAHEIQRPKR